jgi:hypothetical protein
LKLSAGQKRQTAVLLKTAEALSIPLDNVEAKYRRARTICYFLCKMGQVYFCKSVPGRFHVNVKRNLSLVRRVD